MYLPSIHLGRLDVIHNLEPPIGPSAGRGFSFASYHGLPIHGARPRHTIKRRPFFHFQASHSFIIYPAIHFFISPNSFSSALPTTYVCPIGFYLVRSFFHFLFFSFFSYTYTTFYYYLLNK